MRTTSALIKRFVETRLTFPLVTPKSASFVPVQVIPSNSSRVAMSSIVVALERSVSARCPSIPPAMRLPKTVPMSPPVAGLAMPRSSAVVPERLVTTTVKPGPAPSMLNPFCARLIRRFSWGWPNSSIAAENSVIRSATWTSPVNSKSISMLSPSKRTLKPVPVIPSPLFNSVRFVFGRINAPGFTQSAKVISLSGTRSSKPSFSAIKVASHTAIRSSVASMLSISPDASVSFTMSTVSPAPSVTDISSLAVSKEAVKVPPPEDAVIVSPSASMMILSAPAPPSTVIGTTLLAKTMMVSSSPSPAIVSASKLTATRSRVFSTVMSPAFKSSMVRDVPEKSTRITSASTVPSMMIVSVVPGSGSIVPSVARIESVSVSLPEPLFSEMVPVKPPASSSLAPLPPVSEAVWTLGVVGLRLPSIRSIDWSKRIVRWSVPLSSRSWSSLSTILLFSVTSIVLPAPLSKTIWLSKCVVLSKTSKPPDRTSVSASPLPLNLIERSKGRPAASRRVSAPVEPWMTRSESVNSARVMEAIGVVPSLSRKVSVGPLPVASRVRSAVAPKSRSAASSVRCSRCSNERPTGSCKLCFHDRRRSFRREHFL